jgi:hypothetical protein
MMQQWIKYIHADISDYHYYPSKLNRDFWENCQGKTYMLISINIIITKIVADGELID